jgi:hypothetical protein
VDGVIEMLTSVVSDRLALADLVGSAALVAVTVTLWAFGRDAGAV